MANINNKIQIGSEVVASLDSKEVMYDTETSVHDKIDEVNASLNECFQSVSNGKTLVASAITGKGITTASDATFATMAANINSIKDVANNTSGTATAALITKGYTAWVNGVKITGTRPIGAKSLTGTWAPDWNKGKTVSEVIYFSTEFDSIPTITLEKSSAKPVSEFSVSVSGVTTKSFTITATNNSGGGWYLSVAWTALAT